MDNLLYRRIRSVLLDEWDPIGVGSFEDFDPEKDTEYDSYAYDLADIISAGGSKEDVFRYLVAAEKHIGAGHSAARVNRVTHIILNKTL